MKEKLERRGKPGKQERARAPTDVVPGDIAGHAHYFIRCSAWNRR
ncbi:hypothetical protein SedNR2807_16570 [Citrobacter sedlakii]